MNKKLAHVHRVRNEELETDMGIVELDCLHAEVDVRDGVEDRHARVPDEGDRVAHPCLQYAVHVREGRACDQQYHGKDEQVEDLLILFVPLEEPDQEANGHNGGHDVDTNTQRLTGVCRDIVDQLLAQGTER